MRSCLTLLLVLLGEFLLLTACWGASPLTWNTAEGPAVKAGPAACQCEYGGYCNCGMDCPCWEAKQEKQAADPYAWQWDQVRGYWWRNIPPGERAMSRPLPASLPMVGGWGGGMACGRGG